MSRIVKTNDDADKNELEYQSFVQSEAVKKDGFDDPSGVFPSREYLNVATTNFAARGIKKNKVYTGGGDVGLDLKLNPLPASQYPLNKVDQSVSGHVIEVDDTPGAERMLFRHRTGAGVEMRPDGTVIISSTNNTIRVTGGDEKVIIEGDGEIIYNGNLTLNVSGDFDLNVGGDFNVNVAGDNIEDVKGGYKQRVVKNHETTVQKNKSEFVTQTNTNTVLGNENNIIKGTQNNFIEGSVEYLSGDTFRLNAKNETIMSSPNINIGADDITVIGDTGTIGGENVIMYNYNMYTGHSIDAGDTITVPVVYGDLEGTAQKAVLADVTNSQNYGDFHGDVGGASGFTVDNTPVDPKATVLPTNAVMDDFLNKSNKGVKQVAIDPSNIMFKQIDKTEDYGGISERKLSTAEIRSKLRDGVTANNNEFTGAQILEGKLNPAFANITPPSIGRIISADGTPRRGTKIIGNAPGGQVKRFQT